jgi:hypothetical protein
VAYPPSFVDSAPDHSRWKSRVVSYQEVVNAHAISERLSLSRLCTTGRRRVEVLPLVSSEHFLSRIGDSRKDRRLYPWIGEETRHRARAETIGGFGDRRRDGC